MLIIRTLNLISVQSWTYLPWPGSCFSKAKAIAKAIVHHFGYSSENLSKIHTLGYVKLATFSMVTRPFIIKTGCTFFVMYCSVEINK